MDLSFKKSAGGVFELTSSQFIRRPLAEVFDFFSKAENLEVLTPAFIKFSILTPPPIQMRVGCLIDYRIYVRGIPLKWRTEILAWEPPFRFIDKQLKGPYKLWEHTHTFSEKPEGTLVEDYVKYKVFGGSLIERLFVRPDISKIFRFRQQKLLELFP